MRLGWGLLAVSLLAQTPGAADPVFGTTVYSSSGLTGKVYFVSPSTIQLPRFRESRAVGTIYTTSLHVPPQSFTRGFPGITNRFEWFAIDYRGKIWIEQPGVYEFRLLSDDGSKLWINDRLVIDNDGIHPPETLTGAATLSRGMFQLRIGYFQGPRHAVALVLSVRAPGKPWAIFNTDHYLVPTAAASAVGTVSRIKRASNW
jgi:hypothetical protein